MFILHTTIFLVQILVLNKVSILHTILQVQIPVLNKEEVFILHNTILSVQISVLNRKEVFLLLSTPYFQSSSQKRKVVFILHNTVLSRHTSNTSSQNPGCAEEAYILYHTRQDLHPRKVHVKLQGYRNP